MTDLYFPAKPLGWKWPNPTSNEPSDLGLGGYTLIDCEGTDANARFSTVKDPLGSDQTVTRILVKAGDSAKWFQGNRAEMWPYPRDVKPGQKLWRAYAMMFGDGTKGDKFNIPNVGWGAILVQIHDGSKDPAAMGDNLYTLSVTPDGTILSHFAGVASGSPSWKMQQALGRKMFLVTYIEHAATSGALGVAKAWLSLDNPPDVNSAPLMTVNALTLIGGDPWDKLGLYRDADCTNDSVMYSYGAGRSADAATAMKLANFGGQVVTPPPPPPPPPADKFAATRTQVDKFRKSSPNIAKAFDELIRALSA